jgi:predicted dehydrogenase
MASITASNCAIPTRWRGPFTVICEKVTAEFIDHNKAIFTCHGGKPAEEWWPTGEFPESVEIKGELDAYQEEDKAFIAAIEQRKQLGADLKQGAQSLKLVMSAFKSASAGGKRVTIK